MADWGSHPAAPIVYGGWKMNDYDSEDVVLVIAGVFAAFCVGRFLLMFLLVML
ncbi:MAG: hypothetical protein IKQ44_14120 [Lachnospiraceae bacterium]|nr:hypothetical protein [Lachnospiraceae bacterium]